MNLDPNLTKQEQLVHDFIIFEGLSDAEIADKLVISVNSVKTYVKAIRWKIGFKTGSHRPWLVYCYKKGLAASLTGTETPVTLARGG